MVDSPCIGLCVIQGSNGLCRGCWRTLPEIATWSKVDDDRRRAIVEAAKARKLKPD